MRPLSYIFYDHIVFRFYQFIWWLPRTFARLTNNRSMECKYFGRMCLLCKSKLDDSLFASTVAYYISLDPNNRTKLAGEFEAARSTITRWEKGIARPHPRVAALVVEWIHKETK